MEPVGATGRTPRRQYHHHEQTRLICAFDSFPVHVACRTWPSSGTAGQNPTYLRIPSINTCCPIRKWSIAGRRCLNKMTLGMDVVPRCALVSSPRPGPRHREGCSASRSSGHFQARTRNTGCIYGELVIHAEIFVHHRFLLHDEKVKSGQLFLNKIERVLGAQDSLTDFFENRRL